MKATFVKYIVLPLTTNLIVIMVTAIFTLLFMQVNQTHATSYPAVWQSVDCYDYYVGAVYYDCSTFQTQCRCDDYSDRSDYLPLPPGYPGYYTCPNGGTLSGTTCVSNCNSPRYPSGWQTWTDAPITAGISILKGVHINELRTNINLMRADAGLAACSWTDPVLPTASIAIRKVHVDELRSCVSEVYTRCGQAAPLFTDPTITPGVTPAKAVHINELRSVTGNAP